MIDYIFSGKEYIRIIRGDADRGYAEHDDPKPLSDWNLPGNFANSIDTVLYSGSKCYFFKDKEYIRVTRGVDGPGDVDPGYPRPISDWGWGSFGHNGIDAALWCGDVCYFFRGKQYIRVHRGETDFGTVDTGYPKPISRWGWGSFGANGIDSALYSGSKCYFFSGTQVIRVSRGDEGRGIIDPDFPQDIHVYFNWPGKFGLKGIDAALYSGGPLAPPPSTGLVSNYNYFFKDHDNNLQDVSATINFDSDFVSAAWGFGFQLNCYSVDVSGVIVTWQQYLIYVAPGSDKIVAMIDNWAGSYDEPTTNPIYEIVNIKTPFANLPSADRIPAGYQFKIALNYDSNDNVTGATYTVTDDTGAVQGTTNSVIGHDLSTPPNGKALPGTPATAADLAPVVSFTFDIGGFLDSKTAALASGRGTVTYSSSNPLTPTPTEPLFTIFDDGTAENANLIFTPLPQAASTSITQSFRAT
jgi:Hemopexin